MLEKEYDYYKKHKTDLFEKYPNKFIVIKGNMVIGDFLSRTEALKETIKKYPLGSFLIQEILQDDTELIQRFTSRVFV